jgi:hypothetical protein
MMKTLSLIILIILFCQVGFSQRSMILPDERSEITHRYELLKDTIDVENFNSRPWWINNDSQNPNLYVEITPCSSIGESNKNIILSTWIEINFPGRLSLVNQFAINPSIDDQVNGIDKTWRGITAHTEQAFVLWKPKTVFVDLSLKLGRIYTQYGPGRTGQMLFSNSSRPLDQFSINLTKSKFTFTQHIAKLDAINKLNRYFSLHRMEYREGKWQIAINESILYSGEDRNLELNYSNPFIFYHLEQVNGPELEGNTIGSIDFRYRFHHSSLYSELLIDDIQVDKNEVGDLEPNELGFLLGVETSLANVYMGLEYISLTNRTYKSTKIEQWFTHREIPIGYYLGSDLERINFFTRVYLPSNWQFDFEVDLLRTGEGEMDSPWDSPWISPDITLSTGYSEKFPTGIIEQSTILSAQIIKQWSQNKWIGLELVGNYISDENHIKDEDRFDYYIEVNCSWSFWKKWSNI